MRRTVTHYKEHVVVIFGGMSRARRHSGRGTIVRGSKRHPASPVTVLSVREAALQLAEHSLSLVEPSAIVLQSDVRHFVTNL